MTIIQNPTVMDEELFISVLHLLPQLKSAHALPTFADIADLLKSDSSRLYVARYPVITSPIAGILTLVIFRVPSGIRAHIEDVVVDLEFRNKGIARSLMQSALLSAQSAGAESVTLTSHPRRLSANKLYKRLGFRKWDTNLYYFQFDLSKKYTENPRNNINN